VAVVALVAVAGFGFVRQRRLRPAA
jgi:hypothetical protein